MGSGLSQWNDSVGSQFSAAVNNTNNYLQTEVHKVEEKIKSAESVMSRRVPVKSHSNEINNLIVR